MSLALLNRRYRLPLLSFFQRRIRNHADAEDLTHEVFLHVAAAGGGRAIDRPDAYVFQTAANLLRDRSRREQVRADYRQGCLPTGAQGDDSLTPERILAARESLAQVHSALHELSARTRTIFILYRLEYMTRREIAELLGLSVSAVEKHIVRATLRLHERLRSTE